MGRVESMWRAIESFDDKSAQGYDISMNEMNALRKHITDARTDGICTVIGNAFFYGFIKGQRAQKAQQRKTPTNARKQ